MPLNRFLTVRLDKETDDVIDVLKKLWNLRSKSDVIRRAILISMIISDPNMTLRKVVKSNYIEMLKKDKDMFLDVPLPDLFKPLHQLIRELF